MFAKRLLGTALLIGVASLSMAAISMTANVQNGQTIGGTFTFDVKVTSDALVTSVEFYVGDDLRSTDQSTPYQYVLDTLNESEGNFTITIQAYNTNQESVKKTFTLKIDNGLDKGVGYHVDRANQLTRDGKYREAIDEARIALKIDKNSNAARMAMARANYATGTFDLAQKYAEDTLASDPNNQEAKSLLSAINLRRVFALNTTNPTERNEAVAKSLKFAAANSAAVLNDIADKAGMKADSDAIDANLAAFRYVPIAALLRPDWEKNLDNPGVINRFLYALIMGGRTEEANKVWAKFEKYGSPDGYSYALRAVLSQITGDTTGAEGAEKEVILDNPNADITKYTQLYLALSRGRYSSMPAFLDDLEKSNPNSVGFNYYTSVTAFLANDYSRATSSFQDALLADPASVSVLVERGHQVVQGIFAQKLTGSDAKNEANLALAYFEAALTANPSSIQALCGVTLVQTLIGDTAKALSFGRAAVAAGPECGATHLLLAGALRLAQVEALKDPSMRAQATAYRDETAQVLLNAGKYDSRLKGTFAPGPEQAWIYLYQQGRLPYLPLPPK
ncbi:MAG: hypothetical protein JNM28_01305 [Armatimonadetes bacterium]|nr:hypothetical protein [Armatimonadota bacterium]